MPATIRLHFLARTSLFLLLFALPADATDLTGKVTNAQSGEPLGKVQVSVVGTALAAVTATDGTFHLASAPAGKQTLQVSAVGYRSISNAFDSSETQARQIKDFGISLLPDNYQRKEKVEVHGDIFQSPEWPAVGEMTLTSSELQQTSTVLINDPFRSLQALPGVSASGNNDLFAQFSVMGAPFGQVGIYVDDVYVPNLLHTVPGTPDAPTLSLLTGGDVADLRLMPVAYPVRYADAAGAAVVIRTREGDPSPPLIHVAVGMAESEFLGQGAFGPGKKATWLLGARKSYIGYLERYFAGSRFSEDGFYDANLKLTYALTPSQTLSFYATGGQVGIKDPHSPPVPETILVNGNSDLAIARLGWKWAVSPKLLIDARAAFVRDGSYQDAVQTKVRQLDREWSVGTNVSWNWRKGAILQTGYSLRRPHVNFAEQFMLPPNPTRFLTYRVSDVRQDFYLQDSLQLWKDRVRLQGGVRWSRLNTEREQPVTGQLSVNLRVAENTTIEGGWGRYAQLPDRGGVHAIDSFNGFQIGLGDLPLLSTQYVAAVEQRLGERSRLRIEAFDRQEEIRLDLFNAVFTPKGYHLIPLSRDAVLARNYSRGIQVMLQRRSENRLSGWIGYTYLQARNRQYAVSVPPPVLSFGFNYPYAPSAEDQPSTVNIFGSYRLTPSIRLSAKALYGSGFPIGPGRAYSRIGPYERLDLRVDKSWTFQHWKLSLYSEVLNATNHDNRGVSYSGLPIIPTAGLGFDF